MLPMSLTHDMIRGCFPDLDKSMKNWKIAKVTAIIIILLGLLFPLFSPSLFIMCPLFVIVAILLLVMEGKTVYAARCIHNKDYILEIDLCISKDRMITGDGDEFPHLTFEHAGRYYVGYTMLHSNDEVALIFSKLYETAEAGDAFYLLRCGKSRPLYIFNKKFWEIDQNEFGLSNDVFVPKK